MTIGLAAAPLEELMVPFAQRFHEIHSTRWCSWTGRVGWALQALRASTDDGAAELERLLGKWIVGPARRPFFWFVNLIESHAPYLPPLPYNPISAWGRIRASQEWGRHLRGDNWRTVFGGADIPPDALARMRRLYAAAVRMLDDWLARLLGALDRHGLLDETIVIVTSDHGENLGEGGLMCHAYSLDDRLIRVPFLVSGPAAAVAGPCFSLVDLPAWIAASCGIGDHPWRQAAGRDAAVAEFRACGDPDDPWVVDAARTWGIGEIAIRRLTENLRCATNGRRKLLRRGGDEELYDLENDPLELSPVTIGPAVEQRYGDEVATLRAALREASENVAVPPLKAGGKVQEIADIEARMKALGYL